MSSKLAKTLEGFLAEIEHDFPEEHRALSIALESFIELYDRRLISQRVAARTLRQLSKYISRKASDLHPEAVARRAETLRDLRNRLAHGRRLSHEELKAGYDSMWRALLKGARKLPAKDLHNLLAYSLRTPSIAVPSTENQVRTISAFRAIFRALSPSQQEVAFADLLVRLFSEPEFADVLSPRKPSRE